VFLLVQFRGSAPAADFPQNYDVLIGSDLIFAKENIPLLISTFEHFSTVNPNLTIYLASIRYAYPSLSVAF
jgi:hypothetical protein